MNDEEKRVWQERLSELVNDYLTQKQVILMQVKKGVIGRQEFLDEVRLHIEHYYPLNSRAREELLDRFEQYVFGYSVLSPLIDDPEVSDIRVIGYNNVRMKKKGVRMDGGVEFADEKEYRQFIDYVATKNQVNISNMNAIQRFTDNESHPGFILRFTVSMPLVNTYDQPYLCIRKVPKDFPGLSELIRRDVLDRETAELLALRFRSGSTLICGGNSAGKSTILNALKETLPDNMAVLVTQQADELTTMSHPDMMFLHSLPGTGESQVSYDLKDISIAGLTMDVDFFIIGEVKGGEAMYLLNAAYTGQLCAATIHAPSADKALDKLVDYCLYESKYSRDELMKMMDCFKTVVYMERFKVKQIYACLGWDPKMRDLKYEIILDR